MNRNIQLLSVVLLGFSSVAYGQIKEEKLILDKKREPEVRKIEKKKATIETVKTFPFDEKSSQPVHYDITDVPAVSDFQASTLEAQDITPDFSTDYKNNFIRVGMGNYGKVLGDASLAHNVTDDIELGADLHFLSTKGLKKVYPWDSKQSTMEISAFMNRYGEKGKLNLNIGYGQDNYNYYGIYALQPASDIDIQQKTNRFSANGYYDFYSNEILNDVRLKTSFLGDHFDAKESLVDATVNLSKYEVDLGIMDDLTMNADLGIGINSQTTRFKILDQNSTDFFNLSFTPKLTFFKGNSTLMLGSNISQLNTKLNSSLFVSAESFGKTYWFPKAELQVKAADEFSVFLGVDGGLTLNSYTNLLKQNPYLVSDLILKPTETKYHAYVGIKGDANDRFKYNAAIGFGRVKDLLYFRANGLFDTNNVTLDRAAYDYANTFSTAYDSGSFSTIQGSVSYNPIENLNLEAEVNYKKYNLDNIERTLNIPTLTGSFAANYTMLEKKLLLGGKLLFNNSKHTNGYRIASNGIDPMVKDEFQNGSISGFLDLNLSAEYQFHENFSIFALANNLLGKKYEIYKGYQVLGTQILGGIKFSF